MKKLALVLCLVCFGYYGWDAAKDWLLPPSENELSVNDAAMSRAEVFPSAMQNIVPVQDLPAYIDQQRELMKQQSSIERVELKTENEPIDHSPLPDPSPIFKPSNTSDSASVNVSTCFQMGPLPRSALPSINRSIESAGLLEVVRVESILNPDSYVVFIIPTTTEKGARALMTQVRKRGYKSAVVVTEGPLLNAVQLGRFQDQNKAEQFFEDAKQRLHMNDLRMTRLIGKPSNSVTLTFNALTEAQVQALQGLAKKHKQALKECVY